MDKHKKLTKVLFYAVVIVGSGCIGALTSALKLEGAGKTAVIILWLLAILIGWFAVNFIWLRGIDKRVAAASQYLHTDPDRYIDEINSILGDKKSASLQNVRSINIGAAYIEKKDYEKAKELYSGIVPEKLTLPQRAVFVSNLTYAHFMLGEADDAKAVLEKYKSAIEPFRESDMLGGSLAILDIYERISDGETDEAAVLLDKAEKRWTDDKYADDFTRLHELLRCMISEKTEE